MRVGGGRGRAQGGGKPQGQGNERQAKEERHESGDEVEWVEGATSPCRAREREKPSVAAACITP